MTNVAIFMGRNVQNEDLRKITNVVHFAVMPERYRGCSLFISRLKNTDYRNFDLASCFKMNCMVFESLIYENNPQEAIYILDCRGSTFMHLLKVNVHLAMVYFDYIQHGIPLRIKHIHVLYSNRVIYAAFNMIRSFISEELTSKIIFHSTDESLNVFHKKWIPKRYLPNELCGDLRSIEVYHERTVQKLGGLQPYFDAEEKQRSLPS